VKYYFLKLGKGNAEATSLEGKHPTASIYFDGYSEAAYANEKDKRVNSQARLFWDCGKDKNRNLTVMAVIHNATVSLLQPAGKVKFGKRFKAEDGTWNKKKTMPVKVLAKVASKFVPSVLANMACSQRHGRRTFTRIQHWGNLKAIDCVLQAFGKSKSRRWVPSDKEADDQIEEHWRELNDKGKPIQAAAQLLECLGSTELETLVAKLLEAHGCHVPAHRGGTLGDIDLFASNDTTDPINLAGLKIKRAEKISIQVKTWAEGVRRRDTVDYLIGFGVKGKRAFDEKWLLAEVCKQPSVRRWMLRSLEWLPRWYIALPQFGLVPFLAAQHSGGKTSGAIV